MIFCALVCDHARKEWRSPSTYYDIAKLRKSLTVKQDGGLMLLAALSDLT